MMLEIDFSAAFRAQEERRERSLQMRPEIDDGPLECIVRNPENGHTYRVRLLATGWVCACPDYYYRKLECKHILAVKAFIERRRLVEDDQNKLADSSHMAGDLIPDDPSRAKGMRGDLNA